MVTDPLNHTTTYTYTDAGDVATVTHPLGHTTTRTYATVSRLLTSTDPLGRLTWYTYDVLNRLSTVADPLQGLTGFTYDADNGHVAATDPRQSTTIYVPVRHLLREPAEIALRLEKTDAFYTVSVTTRASTGPALHSSVSASAIRRRSD